MKKGGTDQKRRKGRIESRKEITKKKRKEERKRRGVLI